MIAISTSKSLHVITRDERNASLQNANRNRQSAPTCSAECENRSSSLALALRNKMYFIFEQKSLRHPMRRFVLKPRYQKCTGGHRSVVHWSSDESQGEEIHDLENTSCVLAEDFPKCKHARTCAAQSAELPTAADRMWDKFFTTAEHCFT